MRWAHRARRTGPDTSEGGAIVVEMAIVALFLVTLLAGTFDFGMAWRSTLAVTEGARAGARVGTSVGVKQTADRDLLLSTQSTLAASGLLAKVDRIVIFDAGSTNGVVPSACKNATNTGACHIISGATLRTMTETTALETNGCLQSASRKSFCPLSRTDIQLNASYVGVWVRAVHDFQFRLFGSTQTIERTAVMRIEPPVEG